MTMDEQHQSFTSLRSSSSSVIPVMVVSSNAENLDADATELYRSGATKDLLKQLLPGCSLALPLQEPFIHSVHRCRQRLKLLSL